MVTHGSCHERAWIPIKSLGTDFQICLCQISEQIWQMTRSILIDRTFSSSCFRCVIRDCYRSLSIGAGSVGIQSLSKTRKILRNVPLGEEFEIWIRWCQTIYIFGIKNGVQIYCISMDFPDFGMYDLISLQALWHSIFLACPSGTIQSGTIFVHPVQTLSIRYNLAKI